MATKREYVQVPVKAGSEEAEQSLVSGRQYPGERRSNVLKWIAIILGIMMLKGLIIHGILVSLRPAEGPAQRELHWMHSTHWHGEHHEKFAGGHLHYGKHGKASCDRPRPSIWAQGWFRTPLYRPDRPAFAVTPSQRRARMIIALIRPVRPQNDQHRPDAEHDGQERLHALPVSVQHSEPIPALDKALHDAIERAKHASGHHEPPRATPQEHHEERQGEREGAERDEGAPKGEQDVAVPAEDIAAKQQ